MQPPAYKPTKGFPRRTFKGLAGLTIALGIAIIIIGIAEIIYSVEMANQCEYDIVDKVYMDDDVVSKSQNLAWGGRRGTKEVGLSSDGSRIFHMGCLHSKGNQTSTVPIFPTKSVKSNKIGP